MVADHLLDPLTPMKCMHGFADFLGKSAFENHLQRHELPPPAPEERDGRRQDRSLGQSSSMVELGSLP